MKPLPILWKRLVNEGETCPRCGSTQQNVMAAIAKLEPALRPLGIQPVLETQAIDDATFRAAPVESNRIWIGGKPMEEWLGASAGDSPCCEVCGDLPCRTMEVDGQTYEAIPEDLIVKAVIIAASRLLGPDAAAARSSCCSTGCGCN
jgi:Domain of unknown function (DUF2703)